MSKGRSIKMFQFKISGYSDAVEQRVTSNLVVGSNPTGGIEENRVS